MRLGLVRHARPEGVQGVCYGSTEVEVPDEVTRASATALVAGLSSGLRIRCSPRLRCTALAWAVARRTGADAVIDGRLAEVDFGAWEGQRWDDLPRQEIDAWSTGLPDARPGRSGESTRELMDRVVAAWHEWRADAVDELWVTHAVVIRAVHLLVAGVQMPTTAAMWPTTAVPYDEIGWVSPPAATP